MSEHLASCSRHSGANILVLFVPRRYGTRYVLDKQAYPSKFLLCGKYRLAMLQRLRIFVTLLPFESLHFPAFISSNIVFHPRLYCCQACGVCHSDTFTILGGLGATFPAVPGHEVVGKVR